jgi:hypothetical protein
VSDAGMTIDRTPKPCLHKIANHEHGTYACYVLDACRCLPCCFASSEYDRQLKRRNAYGRSNLVDAAPARQRVAELMAAGVGLKQIVRQSGVAQGALWKLMYGKKRPDGTMTPSRRITRANADRLLAMQPGDPKLLADGARVDSTGARRRLQALACLGWSINRLAAEASIDRQPLDQAMRGELITARTARAVDAVYELLWDQPAPARDHREKIAASRARRAAEVAGWSRPQAWDDDTIDDPAAVPSQGETEELVDELAVDAVLEGVRLKLRGATLHAAVHALTATGKPPHVIAHQLGVDERQVYRLRDREQPPRPYRELVGAA